MAVEKKFVKDGFIKASMDEYFSSELGKSGYGGMNVSRTPMGTQITIYSEKPGMVIGKSGKVIRKLTKDVEYNYKIDNPQIDAQEIKNPELNAQIMANKLASSIERGWYFRKAGTNTLKSIMNAGALGCEVIISGKLTGARSRVEKFIDGYIKHSGDPANKIVSRGYAIAIKKLGTLGCKVKIISPESILPDSFNIKKIDIKKDQQDNENITESNDNNNIINNNIDNIEKQHEEKELNENTINNDSNPEKENLIIVENSSDNEIKRLVDGVWQHKHDDYDYWHPVSRIHKGSEHNE